MKKIDFIIKLVDTYQLIKEEIIYFKNKFNMTTEQTLPEKHILEAKIKDIHYKVIIVEYNNHHEKTYVMFTVNKEIFNLNWSSICNKISTTRFSGLHGLHVQDYLQDNGIRFYWNGNVTKEYIDTMFTVDYNKTIMKVVEHSNIGNY